jgi:hypothetical protein
MCIPLRRRSMRPRSILVPALAGVALLGLFLSAGGFRAQAAASVEPATLTIQEPTCYLARGTMEEAVQRTSPLTQAMVSLGGQTGKLCYGSPAARGRTVMGELVPFGQPWRMGADEATALHLPFPASVGDIPLEAGSYSLYAIPGPEEWEIVVNRRAERWGVPINEGVREADMGSFKVPAHSVDTMVERLTFRWEIADEGSGKLVMEWESTRIEIPVSRHGA